MSVGLGANYALYLGGLALGFGPFVALALASVLAMGVNFLGAGLVLGRRG
jgi:hypothetical protein